MGADKPHKQIDTLLGSEQLVTVRELLPGSAAAANALGLDPAAAAGAAGSPGGLAGGERLIRHV